MKVPLLRQLHSENLVMLTVDQNANHVIQKIFNSFDLYHWDFIIHALLEDFFAVSIFYAVFVIVPNKS